MVIRTTGTLLRSMLNDAQVHPGAVTPADVRTIVEVFHRFAAVPVDDTALPETDGDAILAQFGTHDFRGQREFSTDLTRQLVAAGDDDPPTWQLSCTLYWVPSARTEALGSGHLWSFGGTLDEFFTEAAALPGWAWAMTGTHAPRDLTITLDEICSGTPAQFRPACVRPARPHYSPVTDPRRPCLPPARPPVFRRADARAGALAGPRSAPRRHRSTAHAAPCHLRRGR